MKVDIGEIPFYIIETVLDWYENVIGNNCIFCIYNNKKEWNTECYYCDNENCFKRKDIQSIFDIINGVK